MAAESLAPLRVDPTLLGGTAIKPAEPPAKPAPAKPPVPAAPAITSAPVAVTATTEQAATVTPVTPPPQGRELPAPAVTAQRDEVATPVAVPVVRKPEAKPEGSKAAVAAVPLSAQPLAPLARNLPPLRVDPALLGGISLPTVAAATQPPRVAEPAVLPPLYSAHLAVGMVPHPYTTPLSVGKKEDAPTTVIAHRIEGVNDVEVTASGDAQLHRGGDSLLADKIVYRQAIDEVEAIGNVRLSSPDTLITGPQVRMRMEESTGVFEQPVYAIRRQRPPADEPALTISGLPATNEKGKVLVTTGRKLAQPPITGSGQADRLEFRGEDRYHFENASYSTCEPGKRDWEIRVDELDLDYTDERGQGRNAMVSFLNVPLFYSPWMSFSLNNQRKSGFLPPTVGSTSKGGFEVATPWYWNIAPQMDATLTPRVMSRRGVQLNTEFRYLMDTPQNRLDPLMPDKGQIRIEYLPGDQLANRDRYGYAILHSQNLGYGFVGSLNLNGVSDDDYFSDLSTRVSQVSQGNLLRQGILTYGGPWYSAALNVQTYQTLQNLAKPYQRLPQLTVAANRYDLPGGLVANLTGEYVAFDHDTYLTGKRTTLYPQLSLPLATAAFFVTPKIGVHSTQYDLANLTRPGLDDPTRANWINVPTQQSRALPVLTVDSGLFLDRDTNWFDQDLVQTLEPRAYYAYVPTRNQRDIPLFDTGRAGFNYASMFTENRYAGGDRFGNANELTLALTSRMLDTKTGVELVRATIGQRYYFDIEEAQASLPGETLRKSRKADLLAALVGKVLPDTYADVAWQYSPDSQQTERFTIGGRYRPAVGKIFNAAYRYVRDPQTNLALTEQVDFSGQWPLWGGWQGVGRYNYSIKESRVIETIGGLEYNAGCWASRFVVQRLATIADKPTSAVFLQLELNDFSKIGSNPLQLLRRNIPGYGVINQPTADPVFAED